MSTMTTSVILQTDNIALKRMDTCASSLPAASHLTTISRESVGVHSSASCRNPTETRDPSLQANSTTASLHPNESADDPEPTFSDDAGIQTAISLAPMDKGRRAW